MSAASQSRGRGTAHPLRGTMCDSIVGSHLVAAGWRRWKRRNLQLLEAFVTEASFWRKLLQFYSD